MNKSASKLSVAIATVLTAGIAAAAAVSCSGVLDGFGATANNTAQPGNSRAAVGANGGEDSDERDLYIVVFKEPALAGYHGEISGLQAVPRRVRGRGRARLDLKSAQAQQYLSYLSGAQVAHENNIRRALGRALNVRGRMRHALNGMIVDLSRAEAARLQKLDGVAWVERNRLERLDTDLGPALIGAPALWQGSYAGAAGAQQGEGMVVGIIDGGINFGSPSFAAIDPVDGYVHQKPAGLVDYLGTCATGKVDQGKCNDKLIGAWDYVCDLKLSGETQTICENTAKYRYEVGATDTGSHGSHTASTAAGNRRDVSYRNTTLRISGVAPRANVIAYDVCYEPLTGNGSCPTVASVKAINQAVEDGVDVLNFSIADGASLSNPWAQDSVSMAFLNAVDAGVYVATSAGNDGPASATLTKALPWVGMTAAATTGRAGFSFGLNVTGPGEVPAALAPLLLTEGTGGVSPSVSLAGSTPLIVSAGIDAVDDGCVAYAPDTFKGAIAVIRRGTCSFAIKTNNAAAAGAVSVVLANNQAAAVTPSVPGTTIPVFGVTQAEGNLVRDFVAGRTGATAGISFPPISVPNVPDALASFSSRGPSPFNLLMPHVTAPGFGILAAVSGSTGDADDDALVGLMSGTSMASPHHAGSAALLRQARPGWSVPEVLSALEMTAKPEVFKEDTVTPGTALDRGSGRIQLADAVRAGLVLNETKANFLAANPASGGEPAALNLASLAHARCYSSCTFRRTFRNTLSFRQAWTVKLQGVSGTVSPSLFTVNPGESKTVTITVSTTGVPADGSWRFGSVSLTPNSIGNPNQPVLRLPVAVSVPPPSMSLTPSAVNQTLTANSTGSVLLNIANAAATGSGLLNFAFDNSGTAPFELARQNRDTVNTGFRSGVWSDVQTPQATFAADDFVLPVAVAPNSIEMKAFIVSGKAVSAAVSSFSWSIFADDAGAPGGNPYTAAANALWSCTVAPSVAGVTVAPSLTQTGGSERTISLVPATAGCPAMPSLPAGRYWLVVHARTLLADRMAWYAAGPGDGFKTTSASGSFTGTWSNGACTAPTVCRSLAMVIRGTISCGASWMGGATPANGSLLAGTNSNVQLQLDATGLSAGTQTGYACFTSNDPNKPKAAARVNLTIAP